MDSKLKVWLFHGEWLAMMGVMVYIFHFAHTESVRINERLDAHTAQINKRADNLHNEFYELLREMRR